MEGAYEGAGWVVKIAAYNYSLALLSIEEQG